MRLCAPSKRTPLTLFPFVIVLFCKTPPFVSARRSGEYRFPDHWYRANPPPTIVIMDATRFTAGTQQNRRPLNDYSATPSQSKTDLDQIAIRIQSIWFSPNLLCQQHECRHEEFHSRSWQSYLLRSKPQHSFEEWYAETIEYLVKYLKHTHHQIKILALCGVRRLLHTQLHNL